jgi:hypothetical protein
MSGVLQAGKAYQATGKEVLSEAAVLLVAAGFIYFFAHQTYLMSGIMAAILVLRFAVLNRRKDWVFFLIGLLAGGGNDLMSMFKGVYAYLPPHDFSGLPIPVWMLFFWGEIFVFFRKLMRFGPFSGANEPPLKLIDLPLALDLIVVITYRLIIYRTAGHAWHPDALFAAILIVRLLLSPPKLHERRLMLLMLILGPVYEMILIASRLYHYQTGVVLGMPLWLIIYWVFVVRFLKAIFDRMENFLGGRSS